MSFLIAVVTSANPSWQSTVSALGEGATAVIALFALGGAVLQLWYTRKTTRETRAHQYLKRYDDPQLLPYIEKSHRFIGPRDVSGEVLVAEWDVMPFRDRLDAAVFPNFWEELAGMYNRKLVDRDIIDAYFGDAALDYWKRTTWLAEHMRANDDSRVSTDDPGIYQEWETMCATIRSRREKRRKKPA